MKQTLRTTLTIVILGSSLFLGAAAQAVTADQFDYGTYFRTGIGTNNKGGNQTCFTSPLFADHNDFRLGNECGTYSELKLRGTSSKGKSETDPYFAAETMLSFGTANAVDYEEIKPAVRELYIEGGNLFGEKQTYWIGKRYYRDIDAHMDDFFYYGGITGNGAGVTHINTGWGHFAAAWFIASPGATNATAVNDNSQSHYLDFRLSDAPLSETQELNLWLGAAEQKSTSTAVSGLQYGKYSGLILGARHRTKLSDGTNDLAVIFGNGLLSHFTIDNITGFAPNDKVGGSGALRVVDHFTKKFNDVWAMHAVGIFEQRKGYFAADKSGNYWSVGVRPVYFFSDHVHLAVEIGHDQGQDKGAASQSSVGLTRFTIAPELVAARDIWSRPSLRLFYTATFWNNAGKGAIGGPEYATNTSGSNFGAQAEIWF